VAENGLMVCYSCGSMEFQGGFQTKAKLLIISNTNTNYLSETTFGLSISCSMWIL